MRMHSHALLRITAVAHACVHSPAVATVALAVPQIQFKHAIDETPCVIQMDKNNQLHSDCPIFASNVATTEESQVGPACPSR